MIFIGFFVWSGINPKDQFIWFLEASPAAIAAIILAFTYRSFRLTPLAYTLILIHCIILMIGGHFTYSEVPLFDYLKEPLGFSRNNYDKLGHFVQGFVPALVAREIILRKNLIRGRRWQAFFIISFCLAVSALYEIIEWLVVLGTEDNAGAFLGAQGYIWDAQSDMAWALLGAVTSLITLSRLHDRQLADLSK
ncbi:hypothetical protein DBT_1468 [Dissulfuribacter thermophilus]|uniref:DUF2238 domain-containing protein n=1 Tax=Dissulfuribacter thermophilus TaxID=1156395 RepID=A0A1B9F4Y4_9BACT|nr:DUF2238 domain-containing protein [Dissulfuribacter thermophilus]OCC14982.1 hypothetical protein DBT_1468 [Dissulfuribacter thermophilus]